MGDMWTNWSSGADNPTPGSRYNTSRGGGGMWGLESLGSGLASLPQGPVGRENARNRRYSEVNQFQYASKSLLWKANQLRQLGINPAVMAGNEGSRFSAMAGGGARSDPGGGLRGLGQLGDKLISMITDKETRNLRNDETKANINYKNAQAEALRNSSSAGSVPPVEQGVVQGKPSEITSGAPGNPGITAGVKSGKDLYVDEYGGVDIVMNERMAESKESQGYTDKLKDMYYDGIRSGQMALSQDQRAKLRPVFIQELKRTNRLKPGQTIYWSNGLQRFTVQKLRSMKYHTKKKQYRLKGMNPFLKRARRPEYNIMK